MRSFFIRLAFLFCVLSGLQCSSKKEPKLTKSQKRQLELLQEVRERNGLTDVQVEAALERNVKVMDVMNQLVEEGITTEEEMMNLPERLKNLSKLVHQMELDIGSSALSILKLYQSDKHENLEKYLCHLISLDYSTAMFKHKEAYLEFKKKVDDHVKNDPLLKNILENGIQ